MLKVSKLQGAGTTSRPEISPYVLSQMLVPLEMLLCGIVMGFLALAAEMKSKLSKGKENIEEEEKVKG